GCLFKNVLSNWRNGASCFFTSEEDKDFLPSITEWRIDDKSTSVTCKQRYKGVGKIPHRQFTFDTNGKILVDARIIRLSRNGMFLAVLALDKSLKILANLGGLKIAFANELTSGQPTMRQSSAAQYVSSARALGVDNVRGTSQPIMSTSSVPSLSIDRSTDVELRGHPQMLDANSASTSQALKHRMV
nr:hypothetical protein [Tanacetum cinerariifolium]